MNSLEQMADMRRSLTVGEWLVRPLSGTFTRNGVSVHVEPKVMDVFLWLAESPGEVVTREELLNTAAAMPVAQRFPGLFALPAFQAFLRKMRLDDACMENWEAAGVL